MAGVSQNVTKLTKRQVLKLIENRGVTKQGHEYCLEALNERLITLNMAKSAKYENSPEAILAEMNANIQFPPKIKKIKKNVEKPVEKSGFVLVGHSKAKEYAIIFPVSKIKFEVRY